MADAQRLAALSMVPPLAAEVASQIDAAGGSAVTFATVSALTGDWRGEGPETLLAALTALQAAITE